MLKSMFTIGLLLCSYHLFSAESLDLYKCGPMSKDPRCWGRNNRVGGILESGLKCTSNGKAHYMTYHGEGSGCGETGRVFIAKQTSDWSKKTVYVETAFIPGKTPERGPRCAYWGPIYGGGAVETRVGTWKVVVDGKEIGEYTYSVKTKKESDLESSYTQSCKITLD